MLCLLLSCVQLGQAQETNNHRWDFNDLAGWKYGHQDDNPANQCEIKDGILKIFTRAESRDRKNALRTASSDGLYLADVSYDSQKYQWFEDGYEREQH